MLNRKPKNRRTMRIRKSSVVGAYCRRLFSLIHDSDPLSPRRPDPRQLALFSEESLIRSRYPHFFYGKTAAAPCLATLVAKKRSTAPAMARVAFARHSSET